MGWRSWIWLEMELVPGRWFGVVCISGFQPVIIRTGRVVALSCFVGVSNLYAELKGILSTEVMYST